MRVLILLAVLLACCAPPRAMSGPTKSTAGQECIELTPEIVAERAAYEKELSKLSKHMDGEVEELMSYLVTSTGVFTDIKVRGKAFANNFQGALVYFTAHQKDKQITDGYFVLVKKATGEWNLIGLYVQNITPEQKYLRSNIQELENSDEYKF